MGYMEGEAIANKIVTTYRLCSEQLSKQRHYDYGMRAVIAVVLAAGNIKRKNPDAPEMECGLRATVDVSKHKSEESVHRVYGSTVVDISILPLSFKPVSLSLLTFL